MGWTVDDIPSQEGRIALVTGANIGLGLETTRALAQKARRLSWHVEAEAEVKQPVVNCLTKA